MVRNTAGAPRLSPETGVESAVGTLGRLSWAGGLPQTTCLEKPSAVCASSLAERLPSSAATGEAVSRPACLSWTNGQARLRSPVCPGWRALVWRVQPARPALACPAERALLWAGCAALRKDWEAAPASCSDRSSFRGHLPHHIGTPAELGPCGISQRLRGRVDETLLCLRE